MISDSECLCQLAGGIVDEAFRILDRCLSWTPIEVVVVRQKIRPTRVSGVVGLVRSHKMLYHC